jgi:hypothetical protein
MQVVEQARSAHDDDAPKALRAVLAEAMEQLRPDGQRSLTAEWVLYNILEMRFVQGHKVRRYAAVSHERKRSISQAAHRR